MASTSQRPASFGEALLHENLINADQLKQATQEQAETSVSMGRILVDKGWITETIRMTILQKAFGFKLFRLEKRQIEPQVLNLFPLAFAEKHHIVPVAESEENALYVILEDPSDELILGAIRSKIGRPLTPMVASRQDIETILGQYRKLNAEEHQAVQPVFHEEQPHGLLYRMIRSMFLPLMAFLPLVVFFGLLYIDAFDVAYRLQLAIERQYASVPDLVIYIALIWGVWALIIYEIDSLLFGKQKKAKE